MDSFPGLPAHWDLPLVEVDRIETSDPAEAVEFLNSIGLGGDPRQQNGDTAAGVLLGARACADLGQVPVPKQSPVDVPECVVVAYRRGEPRTAAVGAPVGPAVVGEWRSSWSDAEHAAGVEVVREAIARGEVYQANLVGHRVAPFTGDPAAAARAVAALADVPYAGWLAGEGWAIGCASPEQLVRVAGDRVTTVPIKGTSADRDQLQTSKKDRAEHVMIVDLERNDLARVTVSGSVVVEELYALSAWAGLWHAGSTVAGRLSPGVSTVDVLRALVPGGSVTGAPKHAACALLAELEPVGRGPAMGAFGFIWPGGMDLGLTIRTIAAANGQVHLWAGGGITWGSSAAEEVAEANAKAAPLVRALAQVRPSSS